MECSKKFRCCDYCQHYDWYYDYCSLYDIEKVDYRSTCDSFKYDTSRILDCANIDAELY